MMTKEEVGAIETAYAHLKEGPPTWKQDSPEFEKAWSWEMLIVLSPIDAETGVERDGLRLVSDEAGRLVPKFGWSPRGLASIYDDKKGERLISKASAGDQAAHKVLCKVAADFVAGGCTMPTRLREYITEALRSQAEEEQQRRRGQDPYANFTRNFHIASTVLQVTRLGFRPTRNRATERESACSITAHALAKSGLHLTESAVEKIWGQFSRVFTGGPSAS
jgi:hypothetical protein